MTNKTESEIALAIRQARNRKKYDNLDEAAKKCEEKAIQWKAESTPKSA
jgi:hypothetical protein